MTLLDAVDAITNPDVLTRFTGTEHDHEWLRFVRPSTLEERAAVKKTNAKLPRADRKPVPRVIPTGEWWCPWHAADEPVVVVGKPDEEPPQVINRRDDPPLLDQLEARIGSTLGDRGTSGARVGGSPIDMSAFLLHDRIDRTVRGWFEILGARPARDLTLAQLLRSWYVLRDARVNPVGEDAVFERKVTGWQTEIRDVLDPPEQIPYMGQPCPICGQTRVERVVDGDVEDTVALWAFLRPAYRSEGSYGLCRACETVLARDENPILLRQKMNGTIATGRLGFTYQTASQTEDGGQVHAHEPI